MFELKVLQKRALCTAAPSVLQPPAAVAAVAMIDTVLLTGQDTVPYLIIVVITLTLGHLHRY